MNLFSKPAVAASEVTGTEILRRTVRSRNKTPTALSILAGELGIGASALENFGHGRGDLSAEVKNKLAGLLYQTGSFDAETDRLKSTGPPATSLGVRSEPYQPGPIGSGYPPVVDLTRKASFSPGPTLSKPFPGVRPGWAK